MKNIPITIPKVGHFLSHTEAASHEGVTTQGFDKRLKTGYYSPEKVIDRIKAEQGIPTKLNHYQVGTWVSFRSLKLAAEHEQITIAGFYSRLKRGKYNAIKAIKSSVKKDKQKEKNTNYPMSFEALQINKIINQMPLPRRRIAS